jgi:hypothetical protein
MHYTSVSSLPVVCAFQLPVSPEYKRHHRQAGRRPLEVLLQRGHLPHAGETERIRRFIDTQAFLRSYDSAPRPPPPPLSALSKLDKRHTRRLFSASKILFTFVPKKVEAKIAVSGKKICLK